MIYLLRNHEVLSWQCFIINSLGQVPLTWDRNEKNCGVMSSVMVPPIMMFLSTFPAHLLSMTTTHIFSDNYNRTTRQKDSWEALEFFFRVTQHPPFIRLAMRIGPVVATGWPHKPRSLPLTRPSHKHITNTLAGIALETCLHRVIKTALWPSEFSFLLLQNWNELKLLIHT